MKKLVVILCGVIWASEAVAVTQIIPAGEDVSGGDVSYNTNVAYDALQNVNGTAYSSTVATRGTIDVNSGGYAQDTVVNGGIFIVSRGGNVKGTVLRGGRENVSGTDEDATIIC